MEEKLNAEKKAEIANATQRIEKEFSIKEKMVKAMQEKIQQQMAEQQTVLDSVQVQKDLENKSLKETNTQL